MYPNSCKSFGFVVCFVFAAGLGRSATEAPSWLDFGSGRAAGTRTILPDYSYAGYHFSEGSLPDVSDWQIIDVVDYGAIPNDEICDDSAIQAAVNAAELLEAPVVVRFPAGRFLLADEAHAKSPILVRGSHIVLQGAGSGEGGTELYSEWSGGENESGEQSGAGSYRIQFLPVDVSSVFLTTVVEGIDRGDFRIRVADPSKLAVGETIDLYTSGVENLEVNMPNLDYKEIWRIGSNGIRPYEKHLITRIDGDFVTFKNPVQLTIPDPGSQISIYSHQTIEEVGVEGIRFTSAWATYPEEFVHHASEVVDYAWRCLMFENVKNGWIRDCEIKDWNECLTIEKSIGVTVKNVQVTGKKGHASYYARYSYGVLFEDCRDDADHAHGPGMRWSTVNTVYLNCKMNRHQSIDCHGYHPYSNLLDNVYGGTFRGNGGAENSYPNSGPDLTFWNFVHDSNYSSKEFDFWDSTGRQTHTYPYPKFVGFRSPGETISFKNEGLDELRDEIAYPQSLFKAQLQLRLYGGYISASSEASTHPAEFAHDGMLETAWKSERSSTGEWLMMDLGSITSVRSVELVETGAIVTRFVLEGWNGTDWDELHRGDSIGAYLSIPLEGVSVRKLRMRVLSTSDADAAATIAEFTVNRGYVSGSTASIASLNRYYLGELGDANGRRLRARMQLSLDADDNLSELRFRIGTIARQIRYFNETNLAGERLELKVTCVPFGDYDSDASALGNWASSFDYYESSVDDFIYSVRSLDPRWQDDGNGAAMESARVGLQIDILDTGLDPGDQLSEIGLSFRNGEHYPLLEGYGSESVYGELLLVEREGRRSLPVGASLRPKDERYVKVNIKDLRMEGSELLIEGELNQ